MDEKTQKIRDYPLICSSSAIAARLMIDFSFEAYLPYIIILKTDP
jgi:hypothetical protein